MEEDQHIIELKFEGNGIKPSKVKATEVAELIASFEVAVMSVLKEQHPGIDENYVFISFDDVQHKSISLKYLAHRATKYVLPAYLLIAAAFKTGDYTDLPSSSIEELRKITRFAKRHECEGIWLSDGERISSFDKDTEVSYNESEFLKGETTIYGEVKKAGGDNPRITLKIDDDYTISFDVRKEDVIKLAENLYKEVGIRGTAKWHRKTYKIVDFKAESIMYIEQVPIKDTFKELGELFGRNLNKIDDFNSYIN